MILKQTFSLFITLSVISKMIFRALLINNSKKSDSPYGISREKKSDERCIYYQDPP